LLLDADRINNKAAINGSYDPLDVDVIFVIDRDIDNIGDVSAPGVRVARDSATMALAN
jgi:hypothetical protein